MTERLLQFIWQFQYFNKSELITSSGEASRLYFPVDTIPTRVPIFWRQKSKSSNTIWAGNIELHFKTSDWEKHDHHQDENYKNVILHVVWENDTRIKILFLFLN